jgi:hydrogenase nickel incorporation protein HypA/HybF
VHEYSIARALIDRAAEEARRHGATSVAMVRLAIGRQAGLESDLLRTAFELASPRTVCAGARLEIRDVEPLWNCRACDAELPAAGARRCPRCGGAARLTQGGDLILERLELEVADSMAVPTEEAPDVRQLRMR